MNSDNYGGRSNIEKQSKLTLVIRGAMSHRLIKQSSDIFSLVSLCGTQHHDSVFDRQSIKVVKHHMIRLW